jgi:hypothetical protein
MTTSYPTPVEAQAARHNRPALYQALYRWALWHAQQGLTQEAADVLAFLLRCDDVPADCHSAVADLFEELETRICPRVICDAKDFAARATLEDILEYVT